ncbi:MAG: hypothetical protein HY718_17405, partial [Planctomycetes bacterium]|nr:hypothetical protein [Planctomycetota bacterium]
YWRIDEVNAYGQTTGDVWTFRTRRLKADFDQDGDVDMVDYSHLQLCFSGINVPQTDPACQDAKLDADGDVDDYDATLFQGCLSGSDRPASGSCLP